MSSNQSENNELMGYRMEQVEKSVEKLALKLDSLKEDIKKEINSALKSIAENYVDKNTYEEEKKRIDRVDQQVEKFKWWAISTLGFLALVALVMALGLPLDVL